MNTQQLHRILTQDKTTRGTFDGVFAEDRLPSCIRRPSSYVVNFDKANQPGSHWVAIYFDGCGNCEYFDSYGIEPKKNNIRDFIKRNTTRDFCIIHGDFKDRYQQPVDTILFII